MLLTTSPRRAIAGNKVSQGSRCLSIPSKTKMVFPCPSNSSWSWTTNVLMLSHFPSTSAPTCSWFSSCKIFATVEIAASRSSRLSTQSADWTTAWRVIHNSNTELMVKLFPVDFTPWTTVVDGLRKSGWPKIVASWRIWASRHGIASIKVAIDSSRSIELCDILNRLIRWVESSWLIDHSTRRISA